MAFSGKVHDGIEIVLNKELRDQGCVTNIPLDKRIALVGFDVSEVFQVACIGQQIQVDHVHVRMLLE